MKLRYFHWYIILTLPLFIFAVVFSDIENIITFDKNTMAEISIALSAVILTLVGVVTSILTSKENQKRLEFSANLSASSNKLEIKLATNPDRSFIEVYNKSKEKINTLLENMKPLNYSDGIWGILSFVFFLVSSLFVIWDYSLKWIFTSFLIGASFLGGYLLYYIEECFKIDKRSNLPKKERGTFQLQSLKVNGTLLHFDITGTDVSFNCSEQLKRLELKMKFEGKVRNGFLDAFVKYSSGLYSWIPDSNTFLSDFGFTESCRFTRIESDSLNTGLLQTMDDSIELTFDIVLRSENTDRITKGSLGKNIVTVNRQCNIPQDLIVDFIDVRLYEDPLFIPNYKRRMVAFFKLIPKRTNIIQ